MLYHTMHSYPHCCHHTPDFLADAHPVRVEKNRRCCSDSTMGPVAYSTVWSQSDIWNLLGAPFDLTGTTTKALWVLNWCRGTWCFNQNILGLQQWACRHRNNDRGWLGCVPTLYPLHPHSPWCCTRAGTWVCVVMKNFLCEQGSVQTKHKQITPEPVMCTFVQLSTCTLVKLGLD